MDRREVLAWFLNAMSGVLAGCAGAGSTATTSSSTRSAPPSVDGEPSGSVMGVDLPVPSSDLHRSAARDAIPAIVDPAFDTDWEGTTVTVRPRFTAESHPDELRLFPEDRVIGVEREGEARAYPLRILNWHEVVNDQFDIPLLVTYCPLCKSGITARRTIDGRQTVFGVSGLLWKSNLVMYDRLTDSYWSQIAARAIHGPATGEPLELVPSTLTTWAAWQREYPDTKVLRPPPESGTIVDTKPRDYTVNPYEGYEASTQTGPGASEFDDRLHPKTQVIGVRANDEAMAYPLPAVAKEKVINDRVGDLPVVVSVVSDDILVAYVRRIDDTLLTFDTAPGDRVRAGGSSWELTTGRAVDGPYEGTVLESATERGPMFWFAWVEFTTETDVYESAARED